jgi:DNA-directed RNA polymerase
MRKAIAPTQEAVEEWLSEKRTGPRHVAERFVKPLGADVAAYMAVRTVLDEVLTGEAPTRRVALTIAERVIDELRFRRLREQAPGLFAYKMKRFTSGHYGYRKAVLNQSVRWADVDISDLEVGERERLLIGGKLIEAVIVGTGLVIRETQDVRKNGKIRKEDKLVVDSDTLEWIAKRNDAMEELWPVRSPMVVPPKPWAQGERGGYLFALRDKFPLVRGLPRRFTREVEEGEYPTVYAALNRLQDTAYRINERVLGVMAAATDDGVAIAGLPAMRLDELPERPADIDTNEDARKQWRRAAAEVHTRNASLVGKRIASLRTVQTARRYADYEAIYFPWNLDFRGRVYPLVDYLSPQGNDASKGLLEFADARPVGDGWFMLAVHGANMLDESPGGQKVSKMPLSERARLIEELTDRICETADDPWSDLWWAEADKPWCFLAFCFEWADYHRGGRSPDFPSRLICYVDGSATGLQHLSALLRDEFGARAVNMCPGENPQDIYAVVAEEVHTRLEECGDAEQKKLAKLWLGSGLVDRKLVKRPVMTASYGSRQYGFTDQIVAFLKQDTDWETTAKHFTVDNHEEWGAAARFMAGIIWDSLQAVCDRGFAAMEWLQKCARLIAKSESPVRWTVPYTGLRVVQAYFDYGSRRVETVIAGSTWKPRVYRPDVAKPISHEQANGVSPNVVHSLDAAALMMTVVECEKEGIEHFAAVHDSFGTHAAYMPVLGRILRQEFVRLHSYPIITELKDTFKAQTDEEIPEPPTPGSFEIESVLTATYFFA